MTTTVIQHVLGRLADLGIADVFGVPGDYSFSISDAVCTSSRQRWVGCSNELNAAYAADGYARIKGMAALCTTYGVGELSAINGIAGSYAEHLPVFHLVGTPNLKVQNARALMHHTLGDGEYDLFRRMAEPVACAHAVITAQNVLYETERLIAEALYHRRPVYMAFPADQANLPVVGNIAPFPLASSHAASLSRAADAILEALGKATTACLLPGILASRVGATDGLKSFVDNSGLPFATMFMAKSVLDEQHPAYVGMYDGNLMNPNVRDFVEGAELVISVGSPFTDFNSGAFTSNLDHSRVIYMGHHSTKIGAV
ncbi:thiamine pyrophosphate-binding protein, partial [Pseudomonas sp. NPDC086278]|uniref:thiamine pyrophosphate-binding protein n=1 Tax=Pseudomonas sp. NPDC086278 TaxID=3390646 RepID=UPI003CFE00FC